MKLIRQNPFLGKKITFHHSKLLFKISLFTGTLMLSGSLLRGFASQNDSMNMSTNITSLIPVMGQEVKISLDVEPKAMPIERQMENPIVEVKKEEKTIEEMFAYYGKVFEINAEIAYQKAVEITNHFSDAEYVKTYTIGETTVYGEKKDWSFYENGQEIGILAFMRDLRVEASKFGIDQESIFQKQAIEEKSIYQLVAYFSEVFSTDPYIIYSIMSSECGQDFSSNAAISYHNYAGLMNGKTNCLYFYPTKDFGVLEAVLNFKMKYGFLWEQEDEIQNKMKKLQEMYAPLGAENDPTHLNQYWLENVSYFYQLYQEQNIFDKKVDFLTQNSR